MLPGGLYLQKHKQKLEGKLELSEERKRPVLLANFIKGYLEESKLTKRSHRDDVRTTKMWLDFLGKCCTLHDVRPEDLERRRRQRKAAGSADATINRDLKRIFTLAVRDGKADRNPVAQVKLAKLNNARIHWLSDDEEAAQEAIYPADQWYAVVVALHTGLRKEEQLALRWDSVDFRNGVLTIPRSRHGERRHIPMNDQVAAVLRDRHRARGTSPWVYPGQDPRKHATEMWLPLRKGTEGRRCARLPLARLS
ncbi:MAG: tyrosine-type recombinase/integrase [Candidatus Xenobia bacterium]